jgi:putative isomerase
MLRPILLGVVLLSPQVLAYPQESLLSHDGEAFEKIIGVEDFGRLSARLATVNADIQKRGLHNFPQSQGKLLTGYEYGEFYDWDLYFENVYLSYYGVNQYDFTNFKVFLDRQKPDGFISRTIGIKYPKPNQMFKPFLAQIAVLGSKQNGDDYEWLRGNYYSRLEKYLDRWFAYDGDHNGLPVWNSSDASGMDNQMSRSGDLDSSQDEGVDLACYLVRELRAMAVIAGRLGDAPGHKKFAEHADRLAKTINKVFWDEKDSFYYDRNEKTGKRIRVKSVAGFMPLWAGVASRKQADRLVQDHLLNEEEFWLAFPVATYAKTEPDFYQGSRIGECNWRGPVWVPANYMIFHGLLQYGYKESAKELAIKSFRMALDMNKNTREYYDSDTGKGNGMNPFWGWSALAYIMPLDYANSYDPMDLTGKVKPLLKEQLGMDFK